MSLAYAVVTPVRNEAENLERVAAALAAQTLPPLAWIVVDTGSTDGTAELAADLAAQLPWLRTLDTPGTVEPTRGTVIVRAFNAGVAALPAAPDVIVKLDADISFEPDYFERLLAEFGDDPSLGMASGTLYESEDGTWRPRFMTRSSVWGAARAYRARCLADVSPLEERMGWDGIDELMANARGWRTCTLPTLALYHHRREAQRDGSRRAAWVAEGRVAHYMHYRVSYLVVRTLFRALREPSALALFQGYAAAALAREQRCPDAGARAELRRSQRLRALPVRAREALGARFSA
jgi:biofilm PGA synthesis N-glycosyltransferase PgaC